MSEPMKPKTSGLSAGPTAYWDSRSDARKNEEIKRLRGLLKECKPYLDGWAHAGLTRACELFDKIEKEVGDE